MDQMFFLNYEKKKKRKPSKIFMPLDNPYSEWIEFISPLKEEKKSVEIISRLKDGQMGSHFGQSTNRRWKWKENEVTKTDLQIETP